MRQIEHNIQVTCNRWFNYQYPQLSRLFFAIPNGGQRNAIVAAKLKAEGVVAGVADMILLASNSQYNSLCVEFKTKNGRQSDLQKEWQVIAEKHRNKYVIVRSLEDFQNEINEYLKDYEGD